MAKVEYAEMIKTVSGALKKINKKSPHAGDQKMILATHRTAETLSKDCSRIYLRGLESCTVHTVPSQDTVARRLRFKTVAQAVINRKKNLTTLTQDQDNFLAQKNEPNGIKTFKAYLWSLELAAYDQQHNG